MLWYLWSEFLLLILTFEQQLVGLVASFTYVGEVINEKLGQTEAEILHWGPWRRKEAMGSPLGSWLQGAKTQLIYMKDYKPYGGFISINQLISNHWNKCFICNLISTNNSSVNLFVIRVFFYILIIFWINGLSNYLCDNFF